MKSLVWQITNKICVVFFLCKNVSAVHKQVEHLTGDPISDDDKDCSAFMTHGPKGRGYAVYICLSESLGGPDQNLIHEAHHATDELWRHIRKLPEYRNTDCSEYKAYLIQDIVTLFRNWKRDKYRTSKRLLRNMMLPSVDLGWGGIKRKREKTP